jgi:hypothetical protein
MLGIPDMSGCIYILPVVEQLGEEVVQSQNFDHHNSRQMVVYILELGRLYNPEKLDDDIDSPDEV